MHSQLQICTQLSSMNGSFTNVSRRIPVGTLRAKRPTLHRQMALQRSTLCRRPGNKVSTRAVFEQFTERAIKSVMLSQYEAKALGSSEAGAVHILLGLLSLDPDACVAYMGTGASVERARTALQKATGTHRREGVTHSHDVAFTAGAKAVFEVAQRDARRQKHNFVSPEHILVAVLTSGDPLVRQTLNSLGISIGSSQAMAQGKLDGDQEAEGVKEEAYARTSGSAKSTKAAKAKGSALLSFCRDLCEAARKQQLDPVIGRDQEVGRVVEILGRRTKNNPILLGEPGTGKTAVAEGLALAIVQGSYGNGTATPGFLLHKRVLQLDIASLLAGSTERGELENRLTGILEESLESGDVILMIDEIHQIVGAGAVGRTSGFAGGGLDVGNLLKPALARGQFQVIGATTLREHRQHIESDPALERRFQPVLVREPSPSQAVEILVGLQERYERHHGCVYTQEAVTAAVTLSARYITDRFLPDKAIDLLDEAGSRARICAFHARRQSRADGQDLSDGPRLEFQQVLDAKMVSVKEGHWEEAQLLRERELELKEKLAGACYDLPLGAVLPTVGKDDIAAIVSSWTGVPAAQLSEDEGLKLLDLVPALKRQVVGQDPAVEALCGAIQRARTGLRDPKRPVATLFFSGPTGVGKTQLARALAGLYFGGPQTLVRLDMSEYMERHSVSKLVGPPPGFAGYGKGGSLTEAVRRQPHCLLLLDELEKAHPDVCNILLQIFEDGRLTDSLGRTVSFKETLIVMTSNVGSSQISGANLMGFDISPGDKEEDGYTRTKSLVAEELKANFRPELLNRVDDIVVFRPLGKSQLYQIADILLSEVSARLQALGISLQLSSALMSHILEAGFDQAYGARPLKRAITRFVEDPLADAILAGTLRGRGEAYLDLSADGKTVWVRGRSGSENNVVVKSEIVSRGATSKRVAKA